MFKYIHRFLKSTFFTFFFIVIPCQANLLVSPTHLTFTDRQRSEKIVIINTGEVTRSYRIGWKQMQALPQGGYKTLDEVQAKSFNTASDMIRYSPRQVTLRAGERQVIKLALRRPKGLAKGEYRSHLMLTALPPKNENSEDNGSINLKLLLSYTLPVTVRQGESTPPQAEINKLNLSFDKARQKTYIDLSFLRHGEFSAKGNIKVYFTPSDSDQEFHVATLNNYTIYPELNNSFTRITWSNSPFTTGKLRVTYQGLKPYQDITISEKQHQITAQQLLKSE